MRCPICKVDPCICGDKFVNLTDRGLINLVASLCEILKDRNIAVECTVGGEPIADYINQSRNIPIGTLRSIIDSFIEASSDLAKFLDKHQGESVLSMYNLLTEADERIPAFPQLVFILACTDNTLQLRAILLSIYRELYESSALGQCVYTTRLNFDAPGSNSALAMVINEERSNLIRLLKSEDTPAQIKSGITKLTAMLSLLDAVLDPAFRLNVLLTKAIMCFAAFSPNEDSDELKNADYWLCRFFKNQNIDFKGMVV